MCYEGREWLGNGVKEGIGIKQPTRDGPVVIRFSRINMVGGPMRSLRTESFRNSGTRPKLGRNFVPVSF
jgi:hypothetical protein